MVSGSSKKKLKSPRSIPACYRYNILLSSLIVTLCVLHKLRRRVLVCNAKSSSKTITKFCASDTTEIYQIILAMFGCSHRSSYSRERKMGS